MKRLLRQLEDQNPVLASIALDIQEANQQLWDPQQVTWFTDHGPRHSERIGKTIEQIVFGVRNFLKEDPLSPEELLVLIGACYLHDIAMQMTRPLGALSSGTESLSGNALVGRTYESFIRPDHPYIVHDMIYRQHRSHYAGYESLGLHRCPRQLQLDIADVSLSHGCYGMLEQLHQMSNVHKSRTMRLDLLGSLLQVGDVLDVTYERVNPRLLDWLHLPFISESHWVLATLVSSAVIDSRGNVAFTYEVPESILDDAILTHEIRRSVEHDWVATYAAEPLAYLRKRFDLELRLPELSDRNYSHAGSAMVVKRKDRYWPDVDISSLMSCKRTGFPADSKDTGRLKDGILPESNSLLAVMRAIVSHAVFEDRRGATLPLHDTDVGIAHRCGLPLLIVESACQELKQNRIIILDIEKIPATVSATGGPVRKYALCSSDTAGEYGSVWYWYPFFSKVEQQ